MQIAASDDCADDYICFRVTPPSVTGGGDVVTGDAAYAPFNQNTYVCTPSGWHYVGILNKQKSPQKRPIFNEVVRLVVGLGDFLACRGHGEPVVKTMSKTSTPTTWANWAFGCITPIATR